MRSRLGCFNPVEVRSPIFTRKSKMNGETVVKVSIPLKSGPLFSRDVYLHIATGKTCFNPVEVRSPIFTRRLSPYCNGKDVFQSR